MSYTYRQEPLPKVNEPSPPTTNRVSQVTGRLEARFDAAFTSRLALREKQVQQSYRPIIGVHKWFARRPGSVFRSLLLSEYVDAPVDESYWEGHSLSGVIADPFMGGGTPIYEANRLGFGVVGTDINPMAYWVVRQSLAPLDLDSFARISAVVVEDVEAHIAHHYTTSCLTCGNDATVKYFLWVKMAECPGCHRDVDLFPGYLLAEATRHPRHVVACAKCGELNEYDKQPTRDDPRPCRVCSAAVAIEGPARRGKMSCPNCSTCFAYQGVDSAASPRHRLWAIEYHCHHCKTRAKGRHFKKPDNDDLERYTVAAQRFSDLSSSLPIPEDQIPKGDETNRLLRWGYRSFKELFNERQKLGLGLLLNRITQVEDASIREGLLTVFSDFLRYQNMLCRYDTYALKCQDIFSVHGFPVGLVQCENNILGIERVGSGSFRHFVEKYIRAKRYGVAPFETKHVGGRKLVVPIGGESISATFVKGMPMHSREARIVSATATDVPLGLASLDGVFTDPPYYDNVQYAELMDFCYVWLRQALKDDFAAFDKDSTRTMEELTGNQTMGRGLNHFTTGISAVFSHYAAALKPRAPFVFTYHHNEPKAYRPLIVAILDAGLNCTAVLPAAAEMGASLHISGTNSSVLDSVFVCRATSSVPKDEDLKAALSRDAMAMSKAGIKLTRGDLRCLLAGHIARVAINHLHATWDAQVSVQDRLATAEAAVMTITNSLQGEELITTLLALEQTLNQEDRHAATF